MIAELLKIVKRKFDNGQIVGHLLGDSGYPIKPYLLNPLLQPRNRPQERYNESHIKTRISTERVL